MRWFWRRREAHDWFQAQQRRREKDEPKSWHRTWLLNVAILAAMWLLGVGVLSLGGAAFDGNLAVGQAAPQTVVAKIKFRCRDLQRTELERKRAGETAAPVFRLQTGARDDAWRILDKVADVAIEARGEFGAVMIPAPAAPAADAGSGEAEPRLPGMSAEGAQEENAPDAGAEAPSKGKKKGAKKGDKAGAGPDGETAGPVRMAGPVEEPPPEGPAMPPQTALALPPMLVVDAPGVLEDLRKTCKLLDLDASGEDLAKIFPPGRERESANAIKAAVAGILMQGVVSEDELEFVGARIEASPSVEMLLQDAAGGEVVTQRVATADLLRPATGEVRFAETILPFLEERGVGDPAAVARRMGAKLVRASLKYDQAASKAREASAAGEVADYYMDVMPGTTILQERVPVTAQNIEMLAEHNRKLAASETPVDRLLKRVGDYLMMLVVLIACVGWLRSVQPGVYSKTRRKWLLVMLGVMALGIELFYHQISIVHGVIPGWVVPYALPMPLTPMIAVLMLGPEAALATGLWVSLSAALIFGRSFEFLFIGIAGSVTAVAMLRTNVRRRSQLMRAGLVVGCVNTLVAIVMCLLNRHTGETFRGDVIASFASGIVAAVVVSVLLPVLEWAFRHTTDISLLELTDQSHPLLQRLSLEAPGTYHHSRMVATLGQAAADRIGADGLMVAVCASFHDIGKLAKPEFFTENQGGGENPHDNLSPNMSALLIQSHLKEGLTLAKRYRLPEVVCDAIRTHHGTSRISYFYQMAVNDLKARNLPEDPALEASFRYEGPRPWTKEQAILVLADTVEAASRSLEKITPGRIGEMVDRLVRDKLLDGQLDEAPLTLAELKTVKESFAFTLTNILHGRTAYPSANPAIGSDAADVSRTPESAASAGNGPSATAAPASAEAPRAGA